MVNKKRAMQMSLGIWAIVTLMIFVCFIILYIGIKMILRGSIKFT